MTNKFYGIYFDRCDLQVDREGILENPEALQIIEFEYDETADKVTAVRRVNEKGEVIAESWDGLEFSDALDHVGYDDDTTIEEAMERFETWLDEHLEWRESRMETRYTPAEYVCVGITGCVDEEPYRPTHISDSVFRALVRRHQQL